jgi:hypothetical protein
LVAVIFPKDRGHGQAAQKIREQAWTAMPTIPG